jgi:hypothetical protein
MHHHIAYRGRKFVVAEGQVFSPAVADQLIDGPIGDTPRNAASALTLDGYQTRAFAMAAYPGRGEGQLIYPAVALAGEAGELAKVVLEYSTARARVTGVGTAALGVVVACGAIMELAKKVYRNDPPGELTAERRASLLDAIAEASGALDTIDAAVRYDRRVDFPVLALGDLDRGPLVREAGDALWYLADVCTEAGVSLGHVGETNYIKLADRTRRGVIRSTGDDR